MPLTKNSFILRKDIAALQASSIKNGKRVELEGGNRYIVQATDAGSGLLLDNGNFANQIGTLKLFATLALALADTGLVDGDTVSYDERTTSNGGGASGKIVLSSTVIENTFNIVQCTGVPTLSFVLDIGMVIDPAKVGAVQGTDSSAAVQASVDLLGKHSILEFPGGEDIGDFHFSGITIPTSLQGVTIKGGGAGTTSGTRGTDQLL